jgi:hypothetical protein
MLLCFVRAALRHDNPPRADAFGRFCWFVSRRSRASAKPIHLSLRRQSGGRGLRRDGCMGALGSTARSLTAKSQTNLVWSVRSVRVATQEQTRSAHGYCCCPGRAKPRGHIAGLGRYAEHRGLCCLATLGAPLSVPFSAVCGRRNERKRPRSLRSGSRQRMERAES